VSECSLKGCNEHAWYHLGSHLFCDEHTASIVDDAVTTNRVYYGEGEDGLIKIGYSRNVKKRAEGLHVYVLATEPGGPVHERTTHLKFSDLRVGASEWFIPGILLMKHIRALNTAQERKVRYKTWNDAKLVYAEEVRLEANAARQERDTHPE